MDEKYDVIIIGAGIGGLVCGCYLAKAGLKVLIVEQQDKPGGYCTSFIRDGYTFDVGVHYLGGIKNGILGEILYEINVTDEIKFVQFDPTDKIILPEQVVYIRNNINKTIDEFKKCFYRDKDKISDFFNFIKNFNIYNIYNELKRISFKKFLDRFSLGNDFRAAIGLLVLGNMGLPIEKISALTAVIFIREYLFDPGYYPKGGIQNFSNIISKKFKHFGGNIVLKNKVKKIILENNICKGVILDNYQKIFSKCIISNVDATETFCELIDIKTKEKEIINKLTPSTSLFILYLALKSSFFDNFKSQSNIWYTTTYDLMNYYKKLSENIKRSVINCIMMSFPTLHNNRKISKSKNAMQIFTLAPFINRIFWEKNKVIIKDKVINFVQILYPNIKNFIEFEIIATPYDLYRYTLNRDGACYGWASVVGQVERKVFPQKTSIENLFLCGHWCTIGCGQGGISTVALSGKKLHFEIIKYIGGKF